MTKASRFPGDDKSLRLVRDRVGRDHQERRPEAHRVNEPRMDRIVGPLERAWDDADARPTLRADALDGTQPRVEPLPDEPAMSVWTWTIADADARSVLLWTNPVFDHADVARAEFTRLEESDLWTISLRLPSALRASYRIAVWREEGLAPWRLAQGRRPVILAAMSAAIADPRSTETITGSRDECSSIAAGPAAPTQQWASPAGSGRPTDQIDLPTGDTAWVYSPAQSDSATPLLVLFDGAVWNRNLPGILDELIAGGGLPPVHVAMLDARDLDHRWDHVGVPTGQVDVILDHLLPAVRAGWNVSARGADTIVSGQSLGGIGALWTVALSAGEVRHAIAQSPSLWRFDVSEALLDAPEWQSIDLQAGTFESDMLADAADLTTRLRSDARSTGRDVMLSPFEAGHDWAAWRVNLLASLRRVLTAPERTSRMTESAF